MSGAVYTPENYSDRDTVRSICRRLGLAIGRKDDMIRRILKHRTTWQIDEAICGRVVSNDL